MSLRLGLFMVAALALGLGAGAAALLLVVTGDGDPAGTSATRIPGAAVSGPPVRLSGTDVVSGEPIKLGKLAGKRVVVTVWASWCSACSRQAEPLRRFLAKHEETDFFAIDTQEEDSAARAFLSEEGLSIPTIADPDGRLAAMLGVRELPTTLFLTTDHRVASRWEGHAGLSNLEAGLEAARAN